MKDEALFMNRYRNPDKDWRPRCVAGEGLPSTGHRPNPMVRARNAAIFTAREAGMSRAEVAAVYNVSVDLVSAACAEERHRRAMDAEASNQSEDSIWRLLAHNARARNALLRQGYRSIHDLPDDLDELLDIRNFGRTQLAEVYHVVHWWRKNHPLPEED